MLKVKPRLGYHSVKMRFMARLIWAWMLARRACSGQAGVTKPAPYTRQKISSRRLPSGSGG